MRSNSITPCGRNWAIELGNRRQFAEAIELLQQGLAMDATFSAFAQNYVHVHHQWVEHLCREGRFAKATEILSQATAEMPDRDYLRKAQSAFINKQHVGNIVVTLD